MATKLPAAQNRLFKNAFVCKHCKHKIKITPLKILTRSVACRKCGGKEFRVIRKK